MVVAGENISYKRPQYIERSIGRYASQASCLPLSRSSPCVRTFYHYLNVLCPCAFGERSKLDKLGDLTSVGGVVSTAGAQRVAEQMVTSYSRRISRTSS